MSRLNPKKDILGHLYKRRYCRLIEDQRDGTVILQRPLVFRKPVCRFGLVLERSRPVVSIRVYTNVSDNEVVGGHTLIGLYSHSHKFFLGTHSRIANFDVNYHMLFYLVELALTDGLRRGLYNWLFTNQVCHCKQPMLLRIARRSVYTNEEGELLPPVKRLKKGDVFFACHKSPSCKEYKTVRQITNLVNEKDYYIMPPSLPTVHPVVRTSETYEIGEYYIFINPVDFESEDETEEVASIVKLIEFVSSDTVRVNCVCLNQSLDYVRVKNSELVVPIKYLFPISCGNMCKFYPNNSEIQEEAKQLFRHLPKSVRQKMDIVFDDNGEPDWVSTMSQNIETNEVPDPDPDDDYIVHDPIPISKTAEVATNAKAPVKVAEESDSEEEEEVEEEVEPTKEPPKVEPAASERKVKVKVKK